MMRSGMPVRVGPGAGGSVAPSAPTGGVQLVRLTIKEIKDDYLKCEPVSNIGLRIPVARSWETRMKNSDGVTRNGVQFTRVSSTSRRATYSGRNETHVIFPAYLTDQEIIAIGGISGGTGVTAEEAGDQVVQDEDFPPLSTLWSIDSNSGWALVGGAVHLAGFGAGRVYQRTVTPGSLYGITIQTGVVGGEDGTFRIEVGTETTDDFPATPSTEYYAEVRCAGTDILAIRAEDTTQVAIASLTAEVLSPGEIFLLEPPGARVWAQETGTI